MAIPSFSSCQCIFKAHFFVFFLISIMSSLTRIGVSLFWVLGSVDLGSRASSPYFLYAASQRSRLLLPYGLPFSHFMGNRHMCVHITESTCIIAFLWCKYWRFKRRST